jgi:hypothetical protein
MKLFFLIALLLALCACGQDNDTSPDPNMEPCSCVSTTRVFPVPIHTPRNP